MRRALVLILLIVLSAGYAFGEELIIQMYKVDKKGVGIKIGTITATDSSYGVLLSPNLKNLSPGAHGFHLHKNPDCRPATKGTKVVAALGAGGHYDPDNTHRHEGPYGKGHLGDLPVLYVEDDGRAVIPVLAPRLKTSDLKAHSFVIHAGGDNYSDRPKKLGGGGSRAACGVIK
jgi:Cu-Zn family superoxide dismutase